LRLEAFKNPLFSVSSSLKPQVSSLKSQASFSILPTAYSLKPTAYSLKPALPHEALDGGEKEGQHQLRMSFEGV
jgi:hypothetical protein